MAKQITLEGLKQLKLYLANINASKRYFILFTGSKDATGKSWCPDCNDADPVIHQNLKYLDDNSEFITCYVGDRTTYKNPENEFRTDPEVQLKRIPTLLQWKTKKILLEEQCSNDAMVKMLFEED